MQRFKPNEANEVKKEAKEAGAMDVWSMPCLQDVLGSRSKVPKYRLLLLITKDLILQGFDCPLRQKLPSTLIPLNMYPPRRRPKLPREETAERPG